MSWTFHFFELSYAKTLILLFSRDKQRFGVPDSCFGLIGQLAFSIHRKPFHTYFPHYVIPFLLPQLIYSVIQKIIRQQQSFNTQLNIIKRIAVKNGQEVNYQN